MSTKPWEDRVHLVANHGEKAAMVEELDELRQENARLRDALNECVREGDGESTCEQSYLRPVVLMRARAALGES